MVKPYLPKGAKTYCIHPRVPVEYRGAVEAKHVTRSLGTGDLREAKRRVPGTMEKLFQEWDEQLGKISVATEPGAPTAARITATAGFYFDNVEHACAYFYEKARVIEQAIRNEKVERIEAEPDSFWQGKIVRLPDGPLDADPMVAAAAAFRYSALHRYNRLAAEVATGRLEGMRGLVRYTFNPPHCDDPEFVLAMARTLLGFLERIAIGLSKRPRATSSCVRPPVVCPLLLSSVLRLPSRTRRSYRKFWMRTYASAPKA